MEATNFSCVNHEVARVNIVSLHYHFENFRLVNGTFFHELNALVLNCDSMVHIVIKLHLNLILQLSVFPHEIWILIGVGEVMTVLSEETDLAVVCPRVESVSHWILCPDSAVLATSQQE